MGGLFDNEEESFDVYLSSLSNKLMTASVDNLANVMKEVLHGVIEKFDIDRITLFPAVNTAIKLSDAFSVTRDGIPHLPSLNVVQDTDSYFEFWQSSLLAVKFDQEQMKSSDIEVLQKLNQQGVVWHCILPLKMFGVKWGGLSIGQFDENRDPIPEHYLVRLKLIGEMCACYWHFATLLKEKAFHQQAVEASEDALSVLTLKQREVISLLASGYTAKEIGEKLFLSGRTIESHKYRIMDTLDLGSHSELVQFAVKNGLIVTE